MKLGRLLRLDPAAPRRRRRRRDDGPRTIVPTDGDDGPATAPDPGADPIAHRLDAARERLRRAIPPVSDDR